MGMIDMATVVATKRCPFCAEDIRFEAVKCRHCGEMLDGRPRPVHPARPDGALATWKAIESAGFIAAMIAALAFFVSFYPDKVPIAEGWFRPGVIGMAAGMVIWGIGRAGEWWVR